MAILASGDIVNGIAVSANLDFQPAVGTSFCITHAVSFGAGVEIGMFNGTIFAYIGAYSYGTPTNQKIMVNNTNYLRCLSTASGSSYSGIQIK